MRGISHNLPKTAGEEDDDATEYSLAGSSATGAGFEPLTPSSLLLLLLSMTTAQALALSYDTGRKLEAGKFTIEFSIGAI